MKKIFESKWMYLIITCILVAIFCISLTPIMLQNDTYYTVKVGEHIVKNGIDMKDAFSWHNDLNYTYPHWLYDVLIYFIYSIFGFTGIYISTCILSVILGISIYYINNKLVKSGPISLAITIGAMYIIEPYIAARAQLVTFILFIWTVYFIEKFLETKKKKYIIGLIIIPILIANMHVAVFPFYFILYLPYIAEYILCCMAEKIIYKNHEITRIKRKINKLSKDKNNYDKVQQLKDKLKELEARIDKIKIKRSKELQNPYRIRMNKNSNVKWLIIIMIICLLTGFLTPIGMTPYTYLLKTMQGNTTQNINEHQPTVISNETEIMVTMVIFLSILIFTKAKIKLNDLFMLGGLCYLMLISRRQVSMFALVCSIILNRLITLELMAQYLTNEEIESFNKKTSSIIGMLITSILILIISYSMFKNKVNDKFIDETTYPVQACDFIVKNIDLENSKFYNEYNYGSYMIYRGIPVFIDSRADLYDPKFSEKDEDIFMDFIETSGISIFYGDVFEKYGITHVITYNNSKVNMIIEKTESNKYNQLYKDDYFTIYEIVK